MRLQLVVTRGPDMGTVFELEMVGTYILGREEDCSIQLSDPRISRHHCRIVVTGGKAQLEDTNSSWGTLVNGEKVGSYQLQPGDMVRLVETDMRFEVATSAAATTWQPNQSAPQTPGTPGAQSGPPERPVPERPASSPSPPAAVPKPMPPPESPQSASKSKPARSGPPKGHDLSDLVGKTLSRYEITDVITRTRTGMLFRGRDTEKDRLVAFKVLWPEITRDDEEMQRFVRAAKTVVGVRHPNLVALYGAGKSAPRYCWTASELVEGDSLMDVMSQAGQNGQLPWQQCLRVAIHIARAIEAAAAQGFVHRNVTPTNILIRKRDGAAKLGDLMLVKALEGTQAESVTRPGETVGDIPYVSPEQLLSQNDLDFRSDIYSLGAAIYAAVTGKPPIEGKTLAQTIARIESQQPVDPRKLNLSIPPQFAAVILQMLEKEPSERFDTPAALVRRLEKVAKATEQPPVPIPVEDEAPFAGGEVSWRSFYAWVCEIPWPVRQKLMIGAGLIIVAIILGTFLGSHLASSDAGN